jgi:hypothetical protein
MTSPDVSEDATNTGELAAAPTPPAQEAGTPAAKWRENGEPDPHGKQYDGERAALCYGTLTDDELANAVYLDPNIAHLSAAKDRIRWLSRKLEESKTPAQEAEPVGYVSRKYVENKDIVTASIHRQWAVYHDLPVYTRQQTDRQAQEDGWKEVERLLTTIRYIQGIAEHGEKRQMRDDETLEQFVLDYVRKLEGRVLVQEAKLRDEAEKAYTRIKLGWPAQEAEPVAWRWRWVNGGYRGDNDWAGWSYQETLSAPTQGVIIEPLYTHAPSDKLRQAAEESCKFLEAYCAAMESLGQAPLPMHEGGVKAITVNLRAALEGKS